MGQATERYFGEALLRLPAEPLIALRILRLLGDTNASAAELGRLVEADPVISARVLRVANSPFVGLRTPVGSAARAVILLGFSQVRGIAAAAACGLLSEDVALGPDGLWAHSLATAAGAAVAARWIGASHAEAFTAGLLHGLGAAVLCGLDRDGYDRVTAAALDDPLGAERRHFGVDHAEAGATALAYWQLPHDVVAAVRDHHRPLGTADPLSQTVILGKAAAHGIATSLPTCPVLPLAEALQVLGFDDDDAYLQEVRDEVDQLAEIIEATV